MSIVTIKKGTLKITEQSIKELIWAIEKAKNETTFTDDPMPDSDMSTDTFYRLKRERGEILVTSEYAPIDFLISLEVHPNSQESVGYKLICA